MEFREVLYARRSTRAFTDRKVTRDEINTLLDAAIHAPNACNMQSWHFYVITDSATIERFGKESVCSKWASTAPVIFVVCTDDSGLTERFGERAEQLFMIQDTAAAIENLLLCAADIGLGGCWMGAFDEDKCREILCVPTDRKITAIVPVGEPVTVLPMRDRKSIAEVTTFIGESELDSDGDDIKSSRQFVLADDSLPNSKFTNLNLENAIFNNINLQKSEFTDINMSKAVFREANLSELSIENCRLDGMTINGQRIDKLLEKPE